MRVKKLTTVYYVLVFTLVTYHTDYDAQCTLYTVQCISAFFYQLLSAVKYMFFISSSYFPKYVFDEYK